jgi:hypothetical protein
MTQRTNAVDDAPIVSPDRVRTTIQAVLRAAQVAGWTDDALAEASGVKARTIKGYRVEGKEPGLSQALSLMCVLGARGVNPVMALIGHTARPLDEADELQPMMLAAAAMAHLSTIATAASDGRIDHTEERSCREAADMLIATVLPISSAGRAA